ncbi:MAG: type I-E CRISPR-associated protein Cas5/CasD [Verrucomicrobiae bacterium]|nr:type I-E CRISPR-associated protein Cas5/CasD [Verrucomicrobiae bacterium]
MSVNSTLAIYLDAPLQSWGVASQFQFRDTEAHPSKSGILGMVAAAMGIDKDASDEEARVLELSTLTLSTFKLTGTENKLGRPARITRLLDFHTIGGGYDKKNPLESSHIPQKASGGAYPHAVITRRTYLNDARFIAALSGELSLLARIQAALTDPVWGIWLGRKCCLPSAPLLPTIADTELAAVTQLFERLYPDSDTLPEFEGYLEKNDGDVTYWNDEPVSYGQRRFRSRAVQRDGNLT